MTSDETTAAEVIVAITASPSEESIICGTDSKQLYTGALSVADIQRSGDQIRIVFIFFHTRHHMIIVLSNSVYSARMQYG